MAPGTGPGSERVQGSMENTEVFRVIAEALSLASAKPLRASSRPLPANL
jgi:hypothetical protein